MAVKMVRLTLILQYPGMTIYNTLLQTAVVQAQKTTLLLTSGSQQFAETGTSMALAQSLDVIVVVYLLGLTEMAAICSRLGAGQAVTLLLITRLLTALQPM